LGRVGYSQAAALKQLFLEVANNKGHADYLSTIAEVNTHGPA